MPFMHRQYGDCLWLLLKPLHFWCLCQLKLTLLRFLLPLREHPWEVDPWGQTLLPQRSNYPGGKQERPAQRRAHPQGARQDEAGKRRKSTQKVCFKYVLRNTLSINIRALAPSLVSYASMSLPTARSPWNRRKAVTWPTRSVPSDIWSAPRKQRMAWGKCLRWPPERRYRPGGARRATSVFCCRGGHCLLTWGCGGGATRGRHQRTTPPPPTTYPNTSTQETVLTRFY